MPATWKGTVGFGLVAIPVALHTAVKQHDVTLHQVHKKDGGRIRMQRYCEIDGEKVEYGDVAKGAESVEGQTVILEKDDLEKLPVPSVERVEVMRFIPPEQIDPVSFDKPYFVEPLAHGGAAYALLRQAMEKTNRVGLCKVALRTRESLAVLRPHGDALMLETIHWPDEIKEANFKGLQKLPEPREQEVAMAVSLIKSLEGDFDAESESDSYSEALQALVEAKASGATPQTRKSAPTSDNVTDLLTALRASVEASKERQKPAKKATPKKKAKKSA